MATKRCSRCKQVKVAGEFGVASRNRDGLHTYCRPCSREYAAQWREKNPDKVNKTRKRWREENGRDDSLDRDRSRAFDRKMALARVTDRVSLDDLILIAPIIKNYDRWVRSEIRHRVQRGVRRGLSSGKETGVFRHLPYTLDELYIHLNITMPDGCSWGDFADLHIDHIRPVCSFDIKEIGDAEFLKCWDLNNLQLLRAEDNIKKGAKMIWQAEN